MFKKLHYILTAVALLTVPLSVFGQRQKPEGTPSLTVARPVKKSSFQGIQPLSSNVFAQQTPKIKKLAELGDGTILYGALVSSNTWTTEADPQITKFQAVPNTKFYDVAHNIMFQPIGGGWIEDGKYCFVYYYQDRMTYQYKGNYYEYDTKSWQNQKSLEITNPRCFGLDATPDPETGEIYGTFYNYDATNPYFFGTVDYKNTMESQTIKAFPQPFWAIAINDNSECYGIYGNNATLYKINEETGDTTRLGELGRQPVYAQSATFDSRTGKMYWAAMLRAADGENVESALYEINVNTGTFTRISTFPNTEEICGLFIPEEAAENGAPAMARDLKIEPQGTSHNATVTFTAPTKTFAGEAISGTLDYTVQANGETLATGVVEAGTQGVANVSVPADTMYHFVVTTTNDVGESPEAMSDVFIGQDTPKAPATVSAYLSNDKKTINISWAPVSKGIHEGNIETPTYTIVRNEDGKVLATGITGTTYTDTYDKDLMQTYSYSIYAESAGKKGASTSSSSVLVGSSFFIPYTENFATSASMNYFTVVNNPSSDRYYWYYDEDNNCARFPDFTLRQDDWLITPPIKFDGESLYRLDLTYKTGFGGENIGISLGDKATSDAMTTELMPVKLLNNVEDTTISILFRAKDIKYIGIHDNNTEEFGNGISIKKISIVAETPLTAPDSVTNLRVIAAPEGASKATISFNAPSKDLGGNALTSISKVDIFKGNNLVGSVANPQPGSQQSIDDENAGNGFVTYRAIAYNGENGENPGMPSSASGFVGTDIPYAPLTVKLTEGDGNVNLDWTINPENKGVNGGYVDNNALTFGLVRSDNLQSIYKDGITDFSYTDNPDMTGSQRLLYYYVAAKSKVGYGDATASNAIVVGDAYKLPFHESFANAELDNGFWGAEFGSKNKQIASDWDDMSLYNYDSSDNDDGCVSFQPSAQGNDFNEGTLYTGKISLAGSINPTLSFSAKTYYPVEGENIAIEVYSPEKGTVEVKKFKLETAETKKWQKYQVDLSQFIDCKYIIVRFHLTTSISQYLDDVTIKSMPDYDLAPTLSLPHNVKGGTTVNASVTVKNNGVKDADNYTVELLRDGKVLKSIEGTALQADSSKSFSIPVTVSVADPDTMKFVAVVDFAKDMVASNNSDTATVKLMKPVYPVVSDLVASGNNGSVNLTWSAPVLDGADKVITDDFESYEAFTITDFGPWSIAGGAGGTYGIGDGNWGTLKYPHAGEPMTFQIFNPSACGAQEMSYNAYSGDSVEVWRPKSGKQIIAAFSDKTKDIISGEGDNDWLISPELDGKAQTISFWAKQPTMLFSSDAFRVRYSTTDKDTTNFKILADTTCNTTWQEYKYDLPEGTKYFAIQITNIELAAMLDDITYTLYHGSSLNILGYNVYRDGEKINSSIVDGTTFTDNENDGQKHTYVVTVVYTLGESAVSNEAVIATGIDGITANVMKGNVKVYSLDGALIYSGDAKQANLPAGAYLIKNGNHTIKVTMK